ncbi:MAG: glycosyltransferase [Planctomycetaceae bacterium]|nr:glycosyltransferase [Planctomycetaceae bacterium]
MPDRPKILAILPDEPLPSSTGGAVRAWHSLNALSQFANVAAYTLTYGIDEPQYSFPDGAVCTIFRVPETQSLPNAKKRRTSSPIKSLLFPWLENGRSLVLAGQNICMSRSSSPTFSTVHRIYGHLLLRNFSIARRIFKLSPFDIHIRGQLLDQQLSRIKVDFADKAPDIIWVEHTYLFPAAEALESHFPNALVAVNAHNVESELKKGVALGQTVSLARNWGLQEAENVKDLERRMMRKSWFVSCCSKNDAKRFSKLILSPKSSNCQLDVTPNGVDTQHFQKSEPTKAEARQKIIFTGTAGYPPNDEAVRWLIRDIWPQVKNRNPEAQLILAGRNATQYWKPLIHPGDGIQLFSDVPDMRPLVSQASVAIVPILSGSGTRLKILEALSMRTPVVSTSLGAEGLELTPNEEILIADTADTFGTSVCELLGNPSLQMKLAEKGRAIVERQFDWRIVRQNLTQALNDAWQTYGVQSKARAY